MKSINEFISENKVLLTFADLVFNKKRDFFNTEITAEETFSNGYGVKVTQCNDDKEKYNFQLLQRTSNGFAERPNKEFPRILYRISKNDITEYMKRVQLYNKK